MNYRFRSAILAVSLCAGAYAMKANAESAFFPQADLMRVGVYYYPEAWPSNQWARDIANIKKMNLEFVHMGEFAWAFMEPEEGRF
ncbi:MAG: beta-galactosidase, partial [Verrucomicrobiia bacterium]